MYEHFGNPNARLVSLVFKWSKAVLLLNSLVLKGWLDFGHLKSGLVCSWLAFKMVSNLDFM